MSHSAIPPSRKNVILKVLYTFDDKNTFLARSSRVMAAKVITLPPQPPHNGTQIGCVELRKCLALVESSSPEWFQKSMDYSLYYRDVIEEDEPYVGYGLFSKIHNKKSSVLITGRLCTNFLNLYNGGASDTLEIKLRFCPINPVINRKRKIQDVAISESSPSDEQTNGDSSPFEFNEPAGKRKTLSKLESAPLAIRTQSLPFYDQGSLAHRIRLSDMKSSKPAQDLDSRGAPISSRFPTLTKPLSDEQPEKAKKTKSFKQSVVKIGNNTVKNSMPASNSRKSVNSTNKCVNCASMETPPYKFYKDGIFQFGNAGMLCLVCTELQSNGNLQELRERGALGADGLLDGPYSKQIKKVRKRTDKRDLSSSPLVNSSPMVLQNGFSAGKRKASSSKVINNFPILNSTKSNTPAGGDSDLFEMHNILNLGRDLDCAPSHNLNQNFSTDIDQFDNRFVLPDKKRISKNSSPIDSEYEYDNLPIGATKLHTTLIALDDEKENFAPPGTSHPLIGIQEEQKQESISLAHDFSPSIQKIIESFSNNEPTSPTRVDDGNDWNYDFFGHPDQNDHDHVALNDPEMDRILNPKIDSKTPNDKFGDTPKDVGTVQTENDSPNKTPHDALQQPKGKAITMPSSPFFIQDSSGSMNWEGKSSPATEISQVIPK